MVRGAARGALVVAIVIAGSTPDPDVPPGYAIPARHTRFIITTLENAPGQDQIERAAEAETRRRRAARLFRRWLTAVPQILEAIETCRARDRKDPMVIYLGREEWEALGGEQGWKSGTIRGIPCRLVDCETMVGARTGGWPDWTAVSSWAPWQK